MKWIFLAWMASGLLWIRHENGWLLAATILLGYLWFCSALGTFFYTCEEPRRD
jgi:hypothetical protein